MKDLTLEEKIQLASAGFSFAGIINEVRRGILDGLLIIPILPRLRNHFRENRLRRVKRRQRLIDRGKRITTMFSKVIS